MTPAPSNLLALADEQFLALYVANGFNAAAAYREVHPNCSDPAARVLGCRRLTKVHVKARLDELLGDRFKALQMSGDEALYRVALDARSDPRQLVDETGRRLRLHELPDDVANSIEAVEFDEFGNMVKVKLASKTTARRTILEVTGKAKGTPGGVDELVAAMQETLERANGKSPKA